MVMLEIFKHRPSGWSWMHGVQVMTWAPCSLPSSFTPVYKTSASTTSSGRDCPRRSKDRRWSICPHCKTCCLGSYSPTPLMCDTARLQTTLDVSKWIPSTHDRVRGSAGIRDKIIGQPETINLYKHSKSETVGLRTQVITSNEYHLLSPLTQYLNIMQLREVEVSSFFNSTNWNFQVCNMQFNK